MKSVKLPRKAGPADQETMKQVFKYLLCILQKQNYVEEKIFNTNETGLFDREVGRHTYIMQTVFQLMQM